MLMVLLAHLAYAQFASFSLSVDLFFVVSGFLITTLLLEEHRRAGTIDRRRFVQRRAVRLLPMVGLTLVATVLGAWASGSAQLFREARADALAAALYVYHVVHPVGSEITRSEFPAHRPLVQLWSLSVEEHFYAAALVAVLIVVGGPSATPRAVARRVRLLMGGLAVAWLAIGAARLGAHVGPRLAWMQRPDSLMIGMLAALVHDRVPVAPDDRATTALRRVATVAVVVLGAVLVVGTSLAPYRVRLQFSPFDGVTAFADHWYWARFGFSVGSACAAVIVLAIVRAPGWWVARLLAWRPVRAVGVRSYCIYLLHVPLAVVMFEVWGVRRADGTLEPAPLLLGGYLVALVVATELSHRFVEQAALRWWRGRSGG